MPNWCNCSIEIVGPREKIRALWAQAQKDESEGGGLLAALRPEPDYATTPVAETFPEVSARFAKTEAEREAALNNEPAIREDSWWDWRVQNWGSKWDVDLDCVEFVDNDDGSATIVGSFDSAWSPPIEAVAHFFQQSEHLGVDLHCDLMYYEPGMAFAGRWTNGATEEHDISSATADTVRDLVGADIDDAFGISVFMADMEAAEAWDEDWSEEIDT